MDHNWIYIHQVADIYVGLDQQKKPSQTRKKSTDSKVSQSDPVAKSE